MRKEIEKTERRMKMMVADFLVQSQLKRVVEEERIAQVPVALCVLIWELKRRWFSLKTVVVVLFIITKMSPKYILKRSLTIVLECTL